MTELLTSRSRILTRQRCARARYWMDEAFGTGFSPVKVAIPLATGGAVHAGLKTLMLQALDIPGMLDIEDAVEDAVLEFKSECENRQLDLDALESQSFVYAEQLALTEALVRLAGTRVIPRLLELYEVLEVERLDTAPLVQDDDVHDTRDAFSVLFRSIPDALVRSRADGDLYVISWKTTSEYSASRDQDARTDMQGLSEAWALEKRLARWQDRLTEARDIVHPIERHNVEDYDGETLDEIPAWFREHVANGGTSAIRGVQMIYLVKGPRRKNPDGTYATQSPLIKGLRRSDPTGLSAPEFATERYYTCTEPHPFK